MRTKIGDTLVEVALAIGIFSMVAIVIVSVISASTSNAQTALEVTISREDLDAQAEALRFIHDSYVNDTQSKNKEKNKYSELWEAIIANAIPEEEALSESAPEYEINFSPSTCSELYSGDGKLDAIAGKNSFIINIRNLGGIKSEETGEMIIDKSKILIKNGSAADGKNVFFEATTFPRIIYGEAAIPSNEIREDEDFYSQIESQETEVRRVEGIYVIATKGKNKIIQVDEKTNIGGIEDKYAYFDFHIRSCWFPPGAKRASTISTTIRLYDPAVIEYSK